MKKVYIAMVISVILWCAGCSSSTPTPEPTSVPTQDYSDECQDFAEQVKPYLNSDGEEVVVETTCNREMPEAFSGADPINVGQHIIEELDKEGVHVNDWRGSILARIFAKIFCGQ